MSKIWPFDHIEKKQNLYRGKDCMKKFCGSLRERAKNIIDFEKKMLPWTKQELLSHHDAKVFYICGRRILKKFSKSINQCKLRYRCPYIGKYRGAAHSICNLKFIIANEISVDFHNDSNYDYHFIIKELANEFEGKFEWLGGNKEKYKTFSITIEKGVTEIDKDSNRSVVTISYKIKFIDSARFIATSLSNLFDNLTEEIHKRKCKDRDYFFLIWKR